VVGWEWDFNPSTQEGRSASTHQPPTGADADPPTAPHYISSANNNQLTVGETQIGPSKICGRQLGWSGVFVYLEKRVMIQMMYWKINMEPTNHPFRKENDLPNLHEYVPC